MHYTHIVYVHNAQPRELMETKQQNQAIQKFTHLWTHLHDPLHLHNNTVNIQQMKTGCYLFYKQRD